MSELKVTLKASDFALLWSTFQRHYMKIWFEILEDEEEFINDMNNKFNSLPDGWHIQDDDVEDDGYGTTISKWCAECGRKTHQIVRPGKSQCAWCG